MEKHEIVLKDMEFEVTYVLNLNLQFPTLDCRLIN